MKNIIKTLIVMLTSISLFGSANAGELSVSGTAKATYNIQSGTTAGKGLGVTNELNFTASGELDNGYTWSYSMELDPADATDTGAANNDDTQLTLTTPVGTFAVMINEGGLDLEDAGSQSVYSRPTDTGDPSATSDNYTIDGYANVQYHTPADLLPFGITAKIAYAPDLDDTINSGNAAGQTRTQADDFEGRNMTAYQVKAAPIDGLTIGASYNEFSDAGDNAPEQSPESGAYYATYAFGNFTVGYSRAYKAMLLDDDEHTTTTNADYYDQSNRSIAMAVNDDLSISYEVEESTKNAVGAATADIEQKSSAVQVAYNMGGMTVALSRASHDNVGYSTSADDSNQTVIAVTMAF
jgi:outer membrane protein OmpU